MKLHVEDARKQVGPAEMRLMGRATTFGPCRVRRLICRIVNICILALGQFSI